jgi:Putative member of DMT superfamily (DUF486)
VGKSWPKLFRSIRNREPLLAGADRGMVVHRSACCPVLNAPFIIAYAHNTAALHFQCFHDGGLVWASETPLGTHPRGHRGQLLIAFGEYCFQVPANRIGYGEFTGYQLKVIQECITLTVFVIFAWLYLGERIRWNYAVSFLFVLGAVVSAFWGRL